MAEPLRLLIVEDSESGAALVETTLRRDELPVRSRRVADERCLRQALDDGPWDLVIAEHCVPELGALRVLEILDELGQEIPTIVVSGAIGEEAVARVMRAGARDCVLRQSLARLPSAVRRELAGEPFDGERVEGATGHSRALEQLELSEERFTKAFFANPNPAIITTLADSTILEVNEGLCELAGLSREELIGRNGIELGLWDPEHADRMARLLEEEGAVRDLEVRAHGRGGAELDLLLSAVVVEMEGTRCVLNVAVDMTERNRLEARLFQAQRLESIGALAGGIAHDLNNVLTPILMAIKLLRKHPMHQRERVLGILESNARRGADLIRQLLTFARGTEGPRIPVSLETLVSEIAATVRDTFPRSIELEVRLDEDLWMVEGDPTQFHQVLLNLVLNARDAMESKGRLTIRARNQELDANASERHPNAQQGRYVVLEVTDTGPGIPDELRRKVFDPFFTTKKLGHGTGLGLFTVDSIVSTHGGFVEVARGSAGRGARLLVYLPVTGRRQRRTDERAALTSALDGNGELILIVDDEEAVREIAAGVLEASGYRTVPAADGLAAVSRFEERRAEVRAVVIDMVMPRMGGAETICTLRKLDPHLPIIAMSGIDSGSEAAAECAKADLVLSKPLTAEELLASLRKVLQDSERIREAL